MKYLTSLEDLGAATCKFFGSPSEILQKSFRSPAEVQYSCSKCDTQTDRLTFGLLGLLSQPKTSIFCETFHFTFTARRRSDVMLVM